MFAFGRVLSKEMENDMKRKVFISYRREDGSFLAYILYTELKFRGIDAFLDLESLESGDYDEKLLQEIDDCTDFVFVVSKNAFNRCANPNDWVRREVRRALKNENKKNIIPVISVEQYSFPTNLPDDIKEIANYNGVVISDPRLLDAKLSKLISMLSFYSDGMEEGQRLIRDAAYGTMRNSADNYRNVSLRVDTLIGMFNGIYSDAVKQFGEEHAEERVREIFRRAGCSSAKFFAHQINSRWNLSSKSGKALVEEKLCRWCEFDSNVGWGKISVELYEDQKDKGEIGKLTFEKCFIVDIYKKTYICELVIGYCETVISALLECDVKLVCNAATCPLKRLYSSACEFEITLCEQ